jgi:hypothetical protein
MNISKLNKSMLLLVATATVVSQAQAGWLEDFRAQFNPKAVVVPVVIAAPEVKASWLQSGLKMAKAPFGYIANGASYVSGKAMEYPKTSLGIAAATVMVPAFAYGYKKFTSAAPKKSASKKSAQGNSTVKTVVKCGVGLGTVAGLGFGAYKAVQNGYAGQAWNTVSSFASPFVSTTGRKIATGLGLVTLAGAPFAVKAFGGKSDDKQSPKQKEKKNNKQSTKAQGFSKVASTSNDGDNQSKANNNGGWFGNATAQQLVNCLNTIKITNGKVENANAIVDTLLDLAAKFKKKHDNKAAVQIAGICESLIQNINTIQGSVNQFSKRAEKNIAMNVSELFELLKQIE